MTVDDAKLLLKSSNGWHRLDPPSGVTCPSPCSNYTWPDCGAYYLIDGKYIVFACEYLYEDKELEAMKAELICDEFAISR